MKPSLNFLETSLESERIHGQTVAVLTQCYVSFSYNFMMQCTFTFLVFLSDLEKCHSVNPVSLEVMRLYHPI